MVVKQPDISQWLPVTVYLCWNFIHFQDCWGNTIGDRYEIVHLGKHTSLNSFSWFWRKAFSALIRTSPNAPTPFTGFWFSMLREVSRGDLQAMLCALTGLWKLTQLCPNQPIVIKSHSFAWCMNPVTMFWIFRQRMNPYLPIFLKKNQAQIGHPSIFTDASQNICKWD